MDKQRRRAALGLAGEDLVAQHLERQGYQIVGRNVRVGRLELDLIAERDRWLVFVEVRTRSAGSLVHPAFTFDAEKRARIRRAALGWLAATGAHPHGVRFDAAAVLAGPAGIAPRLLYYSNAF
ncbi:MAG: YraN family protein [Polyangiaceae bacterium]|nr:YraN family protein [Polyangiaceae bacterium]